MDLQNHGGSQQAGDSGDKNGVDLVQFGRLELVASIPDQHPASSRQETQLSQGV